MKDDYLLHLETRDVKVIADSTATRPGTKARLMGANNELSIESTGSVQDDKKLKVNDVEVVTSATLRQYVSGILNNGGIGLNTQNTPSLRWVGGGYMDSPLEALASLPAATETDYGIVKVVNEGSHGYPCPGISDRTSAGVWDESEKRMLIFRNGADDLEKDVFLSYYYPEKNSYVPTSERFRPPSLPITAKPLNVVHSGQGTIGINTTDGYFVLLTNNNANWKSWRAIKLDFPGNYHKPPIGQHGEITWRGWFTLVIGNTLYCMFAQLTDASCFCACWTGAITAATTLTMTHQNIHGTNANGTYQSGENVCYVFDKIWGSPGERCMAYNADGYWSGVDTAHAGDDIDWVLQGTKLRICHDGFNWANRIGSSINTRHNISYVVDLSNMVFSFDKPGEHPMAFTRNGWSHPPHRPLMASYGGNHQFSPIRSNGKMMYLETYYIYSAPVMGYVVNNSGLSDFDNLISGNNTWHNPGAFLSPGNYGGVVHMGFGGLHCIEDNIYLGKSADSLSAVVEVDPYGSYGPTIKGYGPTNNRVEMSEADAFIRKSMVSVYDGDRTKLQGAVVWDTGLDRHTQIGMNGPELPVTVNAAAFDALKQQLTAAYRTADAVVNSKMCLMMHRVPGVPLLGTLQILQRDAYGLLNVYSHLFTFGADRVVGAVSSLWAGQKLSTMHAASNAIAIDDVWTMWNYVTTHNLYRLDDGTWAFTITAYMFSAVGNSWGTQFYGVYNPKVSRFVFADAINVYYYLRAGFMQSKEFGFGYGYQSPAGESFYMDRWGKTSAEVFATYQNNKLATKLTMVMSRTDAGDNVSVSQLGATKVRDKIVSLIPPSRRVQGMDLTQDRTITKAMLPNSDRIPNQRDATYPVQQRHRDSVQDRALSGHTHQAGDFTMAKATVVNYGGAVLGNLGDAPTEAVDVQVIAGLKTLSNKLWSRPYSVDNRDPTVPVDVEI